MEIIKNQINTSNKIINLNAMIIGGSGAVGREIINFLVKSPNYSSITIFTRRALPEWKSYSPEEANKLDIIEVSSLDEVLTTDKFSENKTKFFLNKNYDTVFCCLGSRVKFGEEEFRKVDFTYVLNAAKLTTYMKIPHYSVVSSSGAKASSWFLYLRVKGQADEEVLKQDVDCVSVLRPGLIIDRDNDSRFGEKVLKYVPFLDKITSQNLARAIVRQDLFIHENNVKQKKIYFHSEIEGFLDKKNCC